MSGDTAEKNWAKSDSANSAPRGLLTDIVGSLSYMSGENRAERKRQKLRRDLVRDYIEEREQPPSLLQSVVDKLVKQA